MFTRRQVLSSLTGASAAALATRPHRARAGARTLRIGYILPLKSQLGAGATAFAEDVSKSTGGRFIVKQFPDSTLGGDVELLKAVQLGTVDLALVTGMGLSGLMPDLGVLNIPFLFRDAAHAQAVLDGPIGQSFQATFAARDITLLAWGENGLRHITNARKVIATPEDLKGLKIRVPQSDVMLQGFQALGAEAAPLPFPVLYQALQAGTFDGEENPVATIRAAKLDEVQKFLTLSGHAYDPAAFIMSTDLRSDLSPEDYASFVTAARAGAKASRVFAADAEVNGVAALQEGGMTVQPTVDKARFAAAMASANADFDKRFGQDLIAQIRATK